MSSARYSPASLPVGCLDLGQLHPAKHCSGSKAGSAGRLLHVALGEQRGDGFLPLARQPAASHHNARRSPTARHAAHGRERGPIWAAGDDQGTTPATHTAQNALAAN